MTTLDLFSSGISDLGLREIANGCFNLKKLRLGKFVSFENSKKFQLLPFVQQIPFDTDKPDKISDFRSQNEFWKSQRNCPFCHKNDGKNEGPFEKTSCKELSLNFPMFVFIEKKE